MDAASGAQIASHNPNLTMQSNIIPADETLREIHATLMTDHELGDIETLETIFEINGPDADHYSELGAPEQRTLCQTIRKKLSDFGDFTSGDMQIWTDAALAGDGHTDGQLPKALHAIHRAMLAESMGTMTELQLLIARPELGPETIGSFPDPEDYIGLTNAGKVALCAMLRGAIAALGKFQEDA